MLDIERGARDRVEQPRIEKRCHGPWFALVAQNAARVGKVAGLFRSPVEITRLQEIDLLFAFGDKTGLGHPSLVEPRQVTFDFLLAVAVSVELYWLLIRVGEGDGADRGGNRTSRGAGHRLEANKMVRDRARIVPFLQVFSSSRILPFIERLD